jgi:hypothetical protein
MTDCKRPCCINSDRSEVNAYGMLRLSINKKVWSSAQSKPGLTITYSMRHMGRSDMFGCRFAMSFLVVKKDIGAEGF